MSWLWIALGGWLVLACVAAVLIGRVVRRGDVEELGSDLDWDPASLDEENRRSRDSHG
ncbi:hypothetical protein [Prescottella subtropica]|uniref:hypothetical protein n=1 Tax=Prescottella subtropica TaxID=2545757 RepID=UPI001478CA97|nr:hypothetical protein [Prescottella subtropica]